jgi:outer membrane receptor protein involved in Fe transport
VLKHSSLRALLLIFLLCHFGIQLVAKDKKPIIVNVLDSLTNLPIQAATIQLLPENKSFICDINGEASILLINGDVPHSFTVNALGYLERTMLLDPEKSQITIKLIRSIGNLDEIVVSGTRKAERLLASPVSIEKYGAKSIRETSGLDFFDGLKNLKGVDMVSSGLNYKQINSRGFAGTMNPRFLILIDGMDMLAPGLGWNLGNQYGTTELDIDNAELIPGAASALYGPTAFNGMLSMHTKDPFKTTGLSWMVKTGINHVGDSETGIHGLNDVNIRYAVKASDKFAFKVNLAYNNGLDWYANDYTDINSKTPLSLRGENNPAKDGLNIYGDEIQKLIPDIGLVSRTGYEEKYLADYRVFGFKTNATLQYKIKKDLQLTYFQSFGIGNMNYTGSSRYTTNGYEFNTAKLELKGKNLVIRSYQVWENSHYNYNTRTLAQFLNRTWVKDINGNLVSPENADRTWFDRYEQAYKGHVSGIAGNNHKIARSFADQFRILPGDNEFETRKEFYKSNYAPNGAAILTKTSYTHSEGQYDLNKFKNIAEISIGGSLRRYKLLSNGSLFNTPSKGIIYTEFGTFIQAQRLMLKERLKLTSSLRYDKNENFKGSVTPRIAMSLKINKTGSLRASVQSGFRNPTTVDQYIYLRSGLITLLGGAPVNSKGMNVYQNSFTAGSVSQFSSAFNLSFSNGKSYEESIKSNLNLLKKANYNYIQPEKQIAYEIGYKTTVGSRLFFDVNGYFSQYTQFIVNTNVVNISSPLTDVNGGATYMAADEILSGKSTTFQLYTNSNAEVSAYGVSLGLTYRIKGGFDITYNITHSKLNAGTINTSLIAPFNTPNYSTNTILSNSDLFKKIGFSLSWHWQNGFDWYGTFTGNNPGRIHPYSLFDIQFNKKFEKKDFQIKVGGNNILNNRVAQTYGSPAIGAIYYISFFKGIR